MIAQEKGRTTKENIECNFGMPSPEGYRKALRLMKQAEKFGRPIICLVDTPGAFCGLEAEERGQGEAIARNLFEMSGLKVPVLSIVIGEGGSGGALAVAVADEVWMLENSVYSILSPGRILLLFLWKDSKKAKEAAEVMRLTAEDLKQMGVVERVIFEESDLTADRMGRVCERLSIYMGQFFGVYSNMTEGELMEHRYARFRKILTYKKGKGWGSFKLGEKEIKVPVIQGGMGIGISLGNLAGTVAREGGIGLISAAQIGFSEPDFEGNPLEANLRAIEKQLRKARSIAQDGIVGFNIMTAMRDYEKYVRAAVEAGADLIVSGAGLPVDLPAYVKGSNTKVAPIVSTCKSANVILKYWDRKYGRTADMVIIEGPKAGGHLGFSEEELSYYTDEKYAHEIGNIQKTVDSYAKKYDTKIPIAVAGGIDTPQKVKHVLNLGVQAVQVGTRFVTTEECDADIRYKQAYIKACKEDIVIVKSPVGMPGRAIKNTMLESVLRGENIPPRKCYHCLAKCDPGQIPYCITKALIEAAKGNTEEGLLFCGANAYRAEKIETVKEVIANLMQECV